MLGLCEAYMGPMLGLCRVFIWVPMLFWGICWRHVGLCWAYVGSMLSYVRLLLVQNWRSIAALI